MADAPALTYTVVGPVFNEAALVAEFYQRVCQVLDELGDDDGGDEK